MLQTSSLNPFSHVLQLRFSRVLASMSPYSLEHLDKRQSFIETFFPNWLSFVDVNSDQALIIFSARVIAVNLAQAETLNLSNHFSLGTLNKQK